jgi:hypothetical protein
MLKKEKSDAGDWQPRNHLHRVSKGRRRAMKKVIFMTVFTVFAVALLSGCVTMPQTWPDYQRSAEHKMVVIQ